MNLIVARSKNKIIGNENGIPWNCPEDLKFFKEKTKNSIVIMGSKTFDSLKKPLKARMNIVITSNPEKYADQIQIYAPSDLLIFSSIDKLMYRLNDINRLAKKEIFCIGGSSIYNQFLERGLITKIYLTEIQIDVKGDSSFDFDMDKFYLKQATKLSDLAIVNEYIKKY